MDIDTSSHKRARLRALILTIKSLILEKGMEQVMQRGKTLWKKLLSLTLAAALIVTLFPTQVSYAEGRSGDSGTIEGLPEKLMYFSFDETATDGGEVTAKIVSSSDGTSSDA